MSALNIIITSDAAHIVTDGAGTVFGRFTSFTQKAFAIPHLNVAFGLRGNVAVGNAVRLNAQDFRDQAEMLEQLPDKLRRKLGAGARMFPRFYGFDLAVVGISEDGKPFAKIIASIDRPEQDRFTFMDVSLMWSSPPLDTPQLRSIWKVFEANRDVGAIQLIDRQRQNGDVHVGGYVQITTVARRGITTRVVKHYPDEIGSVIDRHSGLSVAVPTSGDWR